MRIKKHSIMEKEVQSYFFFTFSVSDDANKDGSGAVSGRISAGFGSRGFGFGDDFSPTVFGFGAPKPIGFGFPPVDIQWISEMSH